MQFLHGGGFMVCVWNSSGFSKVVLINAIAVVSVWWWSYMMCIWKRIGVYYKDVMCDVIVVIFFVMARTRRRPPAF